MNEENHPWKWYGPQDSQTLIVGTFPTAKHNRSYDFFYPNIANFFWRVLANITGEQLIHFSGLHAVKERKRILDELKITVTDMGAKIIRNENSSLDEKLIPVEYMNIFDILEEKPQIKKILFTSSSGKVSATKWFNNFLTEKNVVHKFPKTSRPIKSFFNYKDRKIELVILYSPSPRAANRISFEKLAAMYSAEIC